MAVERYNPEDVNIIIFSFLTKEEGCKALQMAIDLVAGKCGNFTFLPIGDSDRDISSARGYIGFKLGGNVNALSSFITPKASAELRAELLLSGEELDGFTETHLRKHSNYQTH